MKSPPYKQRGFFITATDTEAGKTWTTLALMELYQSQGCKVGGMKPIASGCEAIDGELINADARLIRNQATTIYPYEWVNPVAFRPPIAPHIAAQQAGVTITLDTIIPAFERISADNDLIMVEGIGGWRVPLGEGLRLADLVITLQLSVIMVVGLRLGCINHALLTTEAIRRDGLGLAGWIANHCQPEYESEDETLDTLAHHIQAPLLGVLPWLEQLDPGTLAASLNAEAITQTQ